jgi:hypothetical protein
MTSKKSEENKIEKAKEKIRKFNLELKSQMKTAIMAAFGFLIALVWKDVITGFVDSISERSPVQGQLVSAFIVTMISVLGIMVITKLLSTDEEKK